MNTKRVLRRFIKAMNKDRKFIKRLTAQVSNDFMQLGGKYYYR